MKYILIVLSFFVLLFSSCTKNFIEEETFGTVHPSQAFTSVIQLETTVNALYSSAGLMYNHAEVFIGNMAGDDVTSSLHKNFYYSVDAFDVSDNHDKIERLWSGAYKTVNQANVILAVIDNITEGADPNTIIGAKELALGQAYFLRALAYFNLVRRWNEIPLKTEYTGEIDLNIKKSSPEDVYDVIISDLDSAIKYLPPENFSKDSRASDFEKSTAYARPSKGSAQALLSSVYLTSAGYPVKHTENYAKAAIMAKAVIDNASTYGFELMTDFADLWKAENDINNETVFGCFYKFIDWTDGGEANINMWFSLSALPEVDFNGWGDYWAQLTFFNNFPAGARKDATFLTEGKYAGDPDLTHWTEFKEAHPYYKKWLDSGDGFRYDSINKTTGNPGYFTGRTVMVMRYSDVLLTYAEADASATGAISTDAEDALNEVRNRAGLPNISTVGLAPSAFVDSVIAERGWEFAGMEPASRWFDLLRTEKVQESIDNRDSKELPILGDWQTHLFLPIPAGEKLLNPNLN